MDETFRAIAEPHRRQILELVTHDELTAGEIAEHFAVTRPAISQHLTVLKRAGLIQERRQGTRRLYRTRREGFAETKLFLEGFWDQRLGRLRRAVEDEHAAVDEGMTERLSVQRELVIAASPEVVWKLLVDPAEAIRWMGVGAVFDPRPGGGYRVEVVPDQVVAGEFVEISRPDRLSFTWGWQGDAEVPPGSTIVVFDLVRVGEKTLLRLTHHDLPDVGNVGSHSRGWGHYLARLATVGAAGSPGPDPWVTNPQQMMKELGLDNRPNRKIRK